ncbi:MAG: 7TM domain-containing protein [Candidatus Kerfeldbacteria bacterium]
MNRIFTRWTVTALCALMFSVASWAVLPAAAVAQTPEDTAAAADSAAENAQQNENATKSQVRLKANAGEDRNVVVGRTVLFDASATTGPEDEHILFEWDFGDGTNATGIDATHVYETSGTYRVTLMTSVGTEGSKNYRMSSAEVIVSVQDRLVMLVTDDSVTKEQVDSLVSYGLTQGALVVSIREVGVSQEYLTVQTLAQKIAKAKEDLIASDIIITWTAGNVGLNSLIELSRISSLNAESLEPLGFGSKAIVAVNNSQSLTTSARTAQSTYQGLQPKYIVVADEEILDDAIRAQSPEELQNSLVTAGAAYQIITEYTERGLQKLSPLNFMSYLMNYMINTGVPVNSLYLILMLPVMATVIAAARQLVGIKAFGIFAPTVIALAFLETGLQYGLIIFLTIIILGAIARILARKLRILYLPRMAIVLSVLALSILVLFFIGAYFDLPGLINISVFPILIMTVITEHFVSVQIEQGYKTAVKLTAETLILSIVGFLIADWTLFKTTMLAYPELILLTLVINYLVGKFSGLRLMEFIRFRKVFKHAGSKK